MDLSAIAPIIKPQMWITAQVRDQQGRLLQDVSEPGHSWVRNFYHFFASMMVDSPIDAAGFFLLTTTGGRTSHALRLDCGWVTNAHGYLNTTANNSDYGILLGTSAEPYHIDDYQLSSRIYSGTGSGQFYYHACSRSSVFNSANQTTQTTISRVFNNNSGAAIIVREAGLAMRYFNPNTSQNLHILTSRDVLGTPVTVPHGALLTVTYTITSPSLTDLDYSASIPGIGTAGSGGFYIGRTATGGASHLKYALILAPASGGQNTSATKWQNTSSMIGTQDWNCGITPSAAMIADGANCPPGVFCAAANAAVLGGYSDWYVPARDELLLFYNVRNALPAGEGFFNASYWSSTQPYTSEARIFNPITNTDASSYKSGTQYTRLVRRVLLTDFVPAE